MPGKHRAGRAASVDPAHARALIGCEMAGSGPESGRGRGDRNVQEQRSAPPVWAGSAAGRRVEQPVLKRVHAGFTGADPHDVDEFGHEDLAVADLAGVGRLGDRFNHLVDLVIRDRDFELGFG